MILRLPNCVNGTLTSHIEQKKSFQTQQPAKFQWKVFLLLMVTEIDFFGSCKIHEEKARLESISGSASATTTRFAGMLFTQFSKTKSEIIDETLKNVYRERFMQYSAQKYPNAVISQQLEGKTTASD